MLLDYSRQRATLDTIDKLFALAEVRSCWGDGIFPIKWVLYVPETKLFIILSLKHV